MARVIPPLEGKVFVVAGASRRLGRCYALALARAGARVAAIARSADGDPRTPGTLAEVAATARAAGHDVAAFACDLSREDEIERAVRAVVDRFGGIDGIVNNAAAPIERVDWRDVPADVWERTMRVDVRAPYLLIARSAPWMIARGGGAVVNVTSLAAGPTAREAGAHDGFLHYGVAKAALNRLTTYLAAELEPHAIAVNALSPGDASAYLRAVNGLRADVPDREVVVGEQLDDAFWGDPLVHLARARPPETGRVLHTYAFGRSWGPTGGPPPQRSAAIRALLAHDNVGRGVDPAVPQ